jgi:uncharacterized protein YcbX
MTKLDSITIYPIKSLDGIRVDLAPIATRGGFLNDRRWAIVDTSGELVNGKRSPKLQTIRSTFVVGGKQVIFQCDAGEYDMATQADKVARYLSDRLEIEVGLVENEEGGFPDDAQAPGPTIVSTASLGTVASWFGISLDECRRRFRPNMEITDVPPFWEERLYAADQPKPFRIGTISFLGQYPCRRCVVPTRESTTGIVTPAFAKTFQNQREASLPDWAARERFDHFYRFTVNTTVDETCWGKSLGVGSDLVEG